MPWMPWEIGPQQASPVLADSPVLAHWSQPDAFVSNPMPLQGIESIGPVAMEPHLAEAHSQSGWNQAHARYGLTGNGQTVAVIDSGIAFDHVALGKGYGPGYKVVGGWDFAEKDARPYDDAPAGFHGTHVSGIIGANHGTHLGVAPDVDLVALRVFTDAGKGDMSWTESALRWVHENRDRFANPITTVNLSLGSAWNSNSVPAWGTLEDELAQLQRDGIVVVASAGNSFQQYKTPGLSYPAASPYVIPVSSIDANGQLSDFSQRDSRSIAAPGRSIDSTVPDYFYGKDGIANDWSTASGTSMAAPYIAGASVLVREAMELVGMQNISAQSIYEHLKSTANSVWDSVTQQNYQSLNLDRAIASLLPADSVGDTLAAGMQSPIQNTWQTDGWINSLSDQDVYRLAPNQSGTLSVQLGSELVDDAVLKLFRGGQETELNASQGKYSFAVSAGETLGLGIADLDSIGSYQLNWSFVATSANGAGGNSGGGNAVVPSQVVDLGSVDLVEQTLSGTSRYKLTAEHTGIMSVVVDAGAQTTGTLQVLRPGTADGTLFDTHVENNQWRIDFNATQGQSIEFVLPGMASRNVHLVNLIQQQGTALTIHGTENADHVKLDLSNGLVAQVAGISYQLDSNTKSIVIAANQHNDTLSLSGSQAAEKVELRPGLVKLENTQLTVLATDFEQIQFQGGGGPDRVYLYDAATDDRLSIWPNRAELTGVGYSFNVSQVDRIFVHAVQGGDDQAFVFDSAREDTLSVRPQFTSLVGTGYFNYVAGFERVFAYSNAGGVDSAALYDSVGNDLFSTSGEVTSIVGTGFSTFARGFENVEAFSNAGGVDRANVYAPIGGKLTSGAGYVGMQDTTRSSVARNFERVETFLAGQSLATPVHTRALEPFSEVATESIEPAATMPIWMPANKAYVSSDGSDEVLDRMDWIANLVEKEMLHLRAGPTEVAISDGERPAVCADEDASQIDMTWIDRHSERAALDAIFAKHA